MLRVTTFLRKSFSSGSSQLSSASLVRGIVPELGPGGPFDHPFYRSLWYWYEVEARVARMRAEAPGLSVHTLSWSTTLEAGALGALVDWVGLPADETVLEEASGRRVNRQQNHKTVELPADASLQEMYEAFRRRLIETGHDPASTTPAGEPAW